MFSKIVPAFTPQNINNLGVLVAIAFIYEAIGIFLAWSTKWFFWLPYRFRYGILCAGTISNYSDIRKYALFGSNREALDRTFFQLPPSLQA